MRLTEGYFRVWLEDVDRLFSQSPKDFSMFYYLLANCHYKDDPFETHIKGTTQKKEIYNEKWLIQKGDYLGSKKQITAFWKFDKRTQKTIFESIAEKGLIEILLEDPALIIRIKNYNHFAWRGKSKERPPIPISVKKEDEQGGEQTTQGGEQTTQGGEQTTQGGGENYTGGGRVLHDANQKTCRADEKLHPKSSLSSTSSEFSSLLREGGESIGPKGTTRQEKESPDGETPPLDNILNFPVYENEDELRRCKDELAKATSKYEAKEELTSDEMDILDHYPKYIEAMEDQKLKSSQISKNTLPVVEKPNRASWLLLIKKRYPNASYEESKMDDLTSKARAILEPLKIDFESVIFWVTEKENGFLKDVFLKTPYKVIEPNEYGITLVEEAAQKTKDYFKGKTKNASR